MMTATRRIRTIAAALALGAASIAAMPAAAQSDNPDARVKKLEAEVRALQRKVFPDGAGKTFAPEITPAAAGAAALPQVPSSSPMTDVLGRLDALESQLARLTSQTEENANGLAQLTTRVQAVEAVQAQQAQERAQAVQIDAVPQVATVGPINTGPVGAAAPSRGQPSRAQPKEKITAPSPERVAAVQKIVKPQTDDPGDDEYAYGFRLWEAGYYPEAEQQLRMFVDKYPGHAQISYGRNLLGRAYLDDGKPKDAATWFLKNYQGDKQGARASDSLLYLAESMIALKDSKRACIALAEFGETYPAMATGRLKTQYQADKGKVTCD